MELINIEHFVRIADSPLLYLQILLSYSFYLLSRCLHLKFIAQLFFFVYWTEHVKQESREEFSDWPHGLLAIGTFGNNELRDNNEIQDVEEDPSPSDDLQDFTPEEIRKLQKELTGLLTRKPSSQDKEKEIANLPLDRFLNCPSSLEVDRRISNTVISDVDNHEDDIERTISVILGRCKDICENNNKKKAIGKRSISFLLKKIFVCSSGFAPQPSLRDTLHESRMEKVYSRTQTYFIHLHAFLSVGMHFLMTKTFLHAKTISLLNIYNLYDRWRLLLYLQTAFENITSQED